MAALQTFPKVLGAVLKKELWPEEAYCRAVLTVDIANLAVVIGTTVVDDGATGTYAQVPANATVIVASDPVAIIIDPELSEKIGTATTGTFSLICLVKGPSVVASGLLTFVGTDAATDTPAEIATNVATVKASLVAADIKLESTFSAQQS